MGTAVAIAVAVAVQSVLTGIVGIIVAAAVVVLIAAAAIVVLIAAAAVVCTSLPSAFKAAAPNRAVAARFIAAFKTVAPLPVAAAAAGIREKVVDCVCDIV